MRQAPQKEVCVPAFLLVVLVTYSPSHSQCDAILVAFHLHFWGQGTGGAGLKAEFQKQLRKEVLEGDVFRLQGIESCLFPLVSTV